MEGHVKRNHTVQTRRLQERVIALEQRNEFLQVQLDEALRKIEFLQDERAANDHVQHVLARRRSWGDHVQ